MTIKNNGTTPDRLIGGAVDVADHFELHVTTVENGIARMRELSEIEIKPGQAIEFKPGGSHVMFVNLKHPLSKGEHINGTLVFERAGKIEIEYSVVGIGSQRAPQDMEHMQH
jgi:copper(I)-binding protein